MKSSRKSSFSPDLGFDIDRIISIDFSMLRSILIQLLNKESQRDQFKSDMEFRIEILKNRIDQLTGDNAVHKREIEELKVSKQTTEEKIQKSNINLSVTVKRVEKTETDIKDLDNYICSNNLSSGPGNVDREELLKLLASKANRDINEK